MSRDSILARREVWKQRMGEFEQGTASVADFCRRAGVSIPAFYQWRRRLKPVPAGSLELPQPSRKAAAPRKATANMKFLPVEFIGQQNVEVQFPCGARVLVPSHDREAIRTILEALVVDRREDRAC